MIWMCLRTDFNWELLSPNTSVPLKCTLPAVAGISLVETLRDPSQATRTSALSQYDSGYSICTDRYRFTAWGEGGSEGRELYDHQTDPGEMTNLADDPQHAETVERLSRLLAERVRLAKQAPKGVKQIDFTNDRSVPRG